MNARCCQLTQDKTRILWDSWTTLYQPSLKYIMATWVFLSSAWPVGLLKYCKNHNPNYGGEQWDHNYWTQLFTDFFFFLFFIMHFTVVKILLLLVDPPLKSKVNNWIDLSFFSSFQEQNALYLTQNRSFVAKENGAQLLFYLHYLIFIIVWSKNKNVMGLIGTVLITS